TGLFPAVQIAVADHQPAALAFRRRLGVDRVLAGPLPLLEAGGVLGQRAGPEGAVLDDDLARGLAVGVELDLLAALDHDVTGKHTDAVAGGVAELAVAEGHVAGGDLDAVAALPVGVDEVVLVDAGAGDEQAIDLFRVGQAADVSLGADAPLLRAV